MMKLLFSEKIFQRWPIGNIAVTRGKVVHRYLLESSWKNEYTDRSILKISSI